MEFPIAFLSYTFTDIQRKWSTRTGSLQSILCSYKVDLQGAKIIVCNDHKPLTRFLNGKNANNKVNRLGLELATYNITFEWISGASNKAADCLSRLVELPQDRQATVQMLTTTDFDGPAFNTRSWTEPKQTLTEHLTPQPNANTVIPDNTTVRDIPDVMLKPLTEDRLHPLLQMHRMDPFYKCIPNIYQTEKPQSMRLTSFSTLKDYYINMAWIQTRNSWPLSYQKLGSTQCLWKHMTNLVTKELLTHIAS